MDTKEIIEQLYADFEFSADEALMDEENNIFESQNAVVSFEMAQGIEALESQNAELRQELDGVLKMIGDIPSAEGKEENHG